MREYSPALIALLKGIVYSQQKAAWENVLKYQAEIKNYFSAIGLDLYLDISEGYAYLKQKEFEEETEIPKLSEKRQLNFHVSLLCLVLRKYLLEQDAQGGSSRTIIPYQEIINRMRLFLPSAADEAKQQDKISVSINRVIEIGFLRKLEDNSDNYEIHRIIKGFINADVIDSTLQKLENHAKEKNL